MSEGRAKESRRAGTAEYVTKDKRTPAPAIKLNNLLIDK